MLKKETLKDLTMSSSLPKIHKQSSPKRYSLDAFIVTLDAAFLAPLACHILRKDTRFGITVSGTTLELDSINSTAHTECCILPEKPETEYFDEKQEEHVVNSA